MNLSHNKKIIKTIAFFVVSSVGTISILGSAGPKHLKKFPEVQETTSPSYDAPQANLTPEKKGNLNTLDTESKFVIKEYKGSVAVFENGKNDPIKKTETMVSDLPVADQEILKKGINVPSQEELLRILEDYCS